MFITVSILLFYLFNNLPSLLGTQRNFFSFRLPSVVHDLPYSLRPPFRLPLVSPPGRTSESPTNKSLFFSYLSTLLICYYIFKSLSCLISSAKVETIFLPHNSSHTHSETVRKNLRAIRKNHRKIAYFRPFIKLKKRFTMLFLRDVSCASLVSLKDQLNNCPQAISIIFDIDDSQGRLSSFNSICR